MAKSPFLLLFHAFSIDFPCSSQRDNKTRLVLFIKVSHSLSHQALCSPARDVNLKGKCCHLKQNKTKKSNSESRSLSIFQLSETRPCNRSKTQQQSGLRMRSWTPSACTCLSPLCTAGAQRKSPTCAVLSRENVGSERVSRCAKPCHPPQLGRILQKGLSMEHPRVNKGNSNSSAPWGQDTSENQAVSLQSVTSEWQPPLGDRAASPAPLCGSSSDPRIHQDGLRLFPPALAARLSQ